MIQVGDVVRTTDGVGRVESIDRGWVTILLTTGHRICGLMHYLWPPGATATWNSTSANIQAGLVRGVDGAEALRLAGINPAHVRGRGYGDD